MFAFVLRYRYWKARKLIVLLQGFTEASNCSQCEDGYYGQYCLKCPACVHGNCTQVGTCECEPHWDGNLCNKCAPTFYGPQCLPLPGIHYNDFFTSNTSAAIVSILPTEGKDVVRL
jgi:hypothetical protein